MDAPLLGREINGRYRLTAALGEGAMGTVYRAERLDGGGALAMKVLQEDTSEDPEMRTRFEREARALFGLQHPNILDVQDYGLIDGRQPYLVMELLTGQSLDQAIDAESIDLPSALEIAHQFLTGLAFAHERGVLHRDLKTENLYLMRGPDGRPLVKLLDFGLVKFVDGEKWGDEKKLTMAGSVLGSPAYMSPEQGAGGAVDARSDVYSAAIVLYELLTGTWPFMAETRMEMLKQHLLTPVPSVAAGRPELLVDPAVDAVFQVALAKDPKSRYPDARALLAAWQSLPQPPVRLPAPTRSVPPPPSIDLASVRPAAPAQMPAVNLPPGPAPGGYAGNPPRNPHAGPAMASPGPHMAPGSPDPRLVGRQAAAGHDFEQRSGGGQRLLIIALAAVLVLLCLASIGVAALLSLSA